MSRKKWQKCWQKCQKKWTKNARNITSLASLKAKTIIENIVKNTARNGLKNIIANMAGLLIFMLGFCIFGAPGARAAEASELNTSKIGATEISVPSTAKAATATRTDCTDLMIVFARGSGAEKDTNDNFLEFKNTIEEKISDFGIRRKYIDLGYEAKGIGVDNIWTLVGAFFGAGDAYDFGESVNEGAKMLSDLVRECPESKFVFGGYSQGAMVVSQGIHSIDSSRVIYAATFGDPKIYLPEGKAWGSMQLLNWATGTGKNLIRTGFTPEACRGKNLSEYRIYVPDCYAYEGMLGSYRPYQPYGYSGKLGTWCNTYDMFCSSYLSASSHTSYIADKLYEDASRVIASKVAVEFAVPTESRYTSPHDTAFLIDSTGSMSDLIESYKEEAMRLAEKTLAAGGRVALYDYRDIAEKYTPVQHCSFETCTAKTFKAGLDEITAAGGGDAPESLLSASLHIMKKLNWNYGSTKSVVVLTDAGYHSPDIDGVTFDEVVKLSKSIDPVNFYIISPEGVNYSYESLAAATGGKAVSSTSDLALLTDEIVTRYDSLPRVSEDDAEAYVAEVPEIKVLEVLDLGADATVKFKNTGTLTMVILNDAVLGATEEEEVTLTGLLREVSNTLRLVPLTETRRGDGVEVEFDIISENTEEQGEAENSRGMMELNEAPEDAEPGIIIPKTPNTGVR